MTRARNWCRNGRQDPLQFSEARSTELQFSQQLWGKIKVYFGGRKINKHSSGVSILGGIHARDLAECYLNSLSAQLFWGIFWTLFHLGLWRSAPMLWFLGHNVHVITSAQVISSKWANLTGLHDLRNCSWLPTDHGTSVNLLNICSRFACSSAGEEGNGSPRTRQPRHCIQPTAATEHCVRSNANAVVTESVFKRK